MKYNEETKDINNVEDNLREAAYNLELPDYMYGTVVPEKELFIKMRNE